MVELNTTGTFPDESDKTPMCYIRCYLNEFGVLKEDILDKQRAIELHWASSDDTLDECVKEVNGQLR